MGKENYIRFDWAMKRLLRDNANFVVLEGLLTTLLNDEVKIQKLLESESNQETEYDKYNRVDILAENSKGELWLIEVQNNNEYAYFQRMLFGTSKLLTEYINRGEGYENIRKVYSVNIVYFALGHGTDYVYHGKTEFRGIHTGELLELTPFQRQKFKVDAVSQLYPEYFVLKVNEFNSLAKTPLEEWIYYLNTGDVPEKATAPGLEAVKEKLSVWQMNKTELAAYYRHLDNVVILRSNIKVEREEGLAEGKIIGHAEGHAEGLAEGIEKGLAQGIAQGKEEGDREASLRIAKKMKQDGLTISAIASFTNLSEEEVEKL